MEITEVKTMVPIEHLVNWTKNPRSIDQAEKDRLKSQLRELGQYKPLIIVIERQYGVVLGGNMRLLALRELNREDPGGGWGSVWVSVVKAPDEASRLKYALSDNDRHGHYDKPELTKIAREAGGADLFKEYRVDLGDVMDLVELTADYDAAALEPAEGEKKKVSFTAKQKICPSCGVPLTK